MSSTKQPVRRLLWTTVSLFGVAMASLWLLQQLVDPGADSAEASIARPAPVTPLPEGALPDLSVGRYIGSDGRIAAEMLADTFLAGEAVFAAMAARNFPTPAPAQVRWYGPGKTLLHSEDVVVRPRQLRVGFVLPPIHTAHRGGYRVEIHHGPEKIASRNFTVQ
jgi:hypothetical protein